MEVDYQHVEKLEEIADWLKIQFNNMDGDGILTIEKIDFTRTQVIDGLRIEAKRPSEHVRKCSCERVYAEDFTIQATDWFKMPIVELIWID